VYLKGKKQHIFNKFQLFIFALFLLPLRKALAIATSRKENGKKLSKL